MKREIKLSQITHNTKKKIYTKEIVMPSDYLDAFNTELKSLSLEHSTDLDLNSIITEEVCNDLRKSSKMIAEMECVLNSVVSEMDRTIESFNSGDESIIINSREEIKKLVQRVYLLSHELYTDELTGLFNRKWFFKEFLLEEKYPKEDGVIAFIDLNGLKFVNDSFGHKVGDKTISFLGAHLKDTIKDSSIVRFAGDEFLILFNNRNISDVMNIMSDINNNLSKIELRTKKENEEHKFSITFSFGLAEYESGVNIISSIEKADQNMYEMKNITKKIRKSEI